MFPVKGLICGWWLQPVLSVIRLACERVNFHFEKNDYVACVIHKIPLVGYFALAWIVFAY